MKMPGVNPTVFYIGLIVLIIAAGIGIYFKLPIPTELIIALVSALIGHGLTLTTQHIQRKNGS
jgi:FtsH-binding integral membrane protein